MSATHKIYRELQWQINRLNRLKSTETLPGHWARCQAKIDGLRFALKIGLK